MRFALLASLAFLAACVSANAAGEERIDFNRDIRPILSENCFYCHGQDANKRQAELRLDLRDAAVEAGAIVPNDIVGSALIERINSDDPDVIMPPPMSNRRLTAAQKDTLARWIAAGAVYESHWAFVAPVRPAEPNVQRQDWARSAIDRFVLAKLEAEGLSPSPEADRATLIKRLSIDLTGLPPTPQEVDAFVADPDPRGYETLADRLLDSRHYGERMALPWLDAARYADSNGFQQDGDTWQWMWRDWVVRALNDDLPFDQFTIGQLAGDLLPDATIEQQIASGFNRNHLLNGEGGAIPEEQRFVILFDRIDTTATTWLGLTMACAQCHDHKYDPITRRDYYSLLDAFNRVPESGTPQRQSSRIRVAAPFIELPTEENKARIAEFEAQIAAAEAEAKQPDVGKLDNLKKQLAEYRGDQIPRVMVMSDAQPRETSILDRGEYLNPTEKVSFATPAFLPPLADAAPTNRLGFAQWLVSPEHPLTARVQVNRMWHYFFGAGIVKTSEDFGVQSEYPLHKDLLDWLAVEFRESGWSMKKMHRLIVTSATYRQSSRLTEQLREQDSENRRYARASRFRMPSMLLRDWALASGGLLDPRVGGAPVYPYQPSDVWEALAITKERDFTYPASSGQDLYRRSLYTFWRRTVNPANMFDASNRQACRVKLATTSTPLHALTTLNDPTWVEAARALAQQSMQSGATLDEQLTAAFRRVLIRPPTESDMVLLRRAHEKQATIYRADLDAAKAFVSVGTAPRDESLNVTEHAALTAVCLAILNLDEALTRE
ncbi:MAG: PSD1 and planctomycete cytochrome C domain-containing protein [Planctomycetota bacterium]|nr:PSD1 and planctomycete cytochrome C domain-containing protein [Planctomycetota bacterium]